MKLAFSFFILLLGSLGVKADDEPVCPSVDIGKDIQGFRKDLTLKVFDTYIETADELTEEALDELRCLTESHQSYHRLASYIVASWLSVFLGRLDHLPPFCGAAQIINASLSDNDPDQLRSGLDGVTDLLNTFLIYRQQNGIDASGCEAPSVIDNLTIPICWKDGFAYNIDSLWKKRGHLLPDQFCGIAHRLYKSHLVVNKLIAVVLSYTITEQVQYLLERAIGEESIKAVWLQYSCEIPKCCCPDRLALVKSLSDVVIKRTREIFNEIRPPCICPSLNVPPKDQPSLMRNTTNIILSKPPPNLSKAGRAVRDELKRMINSGNKAHAKIASSTLIIYQTFADNIKIAPSFCAYAKFINETVVYAKDKKRAKMADAIEGLVKFFPYLFYLFHKDGVSASMCESGPVPKPAIAPPSGCYKDGFAYNIDGLWCLKEDFVPCTLPEKVKCLYNSKNQLDKVLANILTYVVSDPLFDPIGQDITYKNIKAKYSSKIQKCCCEDRLKELNDIEAQTLNALANAIEKAKKIIL